LNVNTPFGPHRITLNRQVALPKTLMERVQLLPGDHVYFIEVEEHEGALLIVPVERLAAWIEQGRRASGSR